MGMTIAEKVLARNAGLDKVEPGQMVMARIDRTSIIDVQLPGVWMAFKELGLKKLWDPEKVVLTIEHNAPPSLPLLADAYAECRQFVKEFGITHFYEIGRHGICHINFIERGLARPGELVTSGDSHSCIYGALNVVSRGIGGTELVYLLAKGMLWFKVPETVGMELQGSLPPLSSGKDILLHIAGKYGSEDLLYKSIEYTGDGAKELPISGRITMCCMGIELGAKFALFEADEKTIEYVRQRTDQPFEPVKSDPDAHFAARHSIDLSQIGPQVACPHKVTNVKPVEQVEGIPVQQGFIGSCTNSSIDDLRSAAKILHGKKVHPDTRLIIIPGSMKIYRQALKEGLLETFLDAEAVVEGPTCGPCGGASKGLIGKGETCISTSNRNFKGRMGSAEAEVYLASPATVAASSVNGKIADPRKAV